MGLAFTLPAARNPSNHRLVNIPVFLVDKARNNMDAPGFIDHDARWGKYHSITDHGANGFFDDTD